MFPREGGDDASVHTRAWSSGKILQLNLHLHRHLTSFGKPCIAVFLFYNGSEEEGRTNFKAYLDLGTFLSWLSCITFRVCSQLLQVLWLT